jgi:hypothetical protein
MIRDDTAELSQSTKKAAWGSVGEIDAMVLNPKPLQEAEIGTIQARYVHVVTQYGLLAGQVNRHIDDSVTRVVDTVKQVEDNQLGVRILMRASRTAATWPPRCHEASQSLTFSVKTDLSNCWAARLAAAMSHESAVR